MLTIKNLHVSASGKKILQGINLSLKPRELHVLMGPNGSGKSSLAHVILGDPKYKITKGKIVFGNQVINHLPIEKRVKLGLALAWQQPPVIKGISLAALLDKIGSPDNAEKLKLGPRLLSREVNLNLSGGEKKISELLQVLHLKPKLIIFDEIDSGLDIKNLERITKIVQKQIANNQTAVLMVTHSGEVLRLLKPHHTSIMFRGKIICQNKDSKKILQTIKRYGYKQCEQCALLAD